MRSINEILQSEDDSDYAWAVRALHLALAMTRNDYARCVLLPGSENEKLLACQQNGGVVARMLSADPESWFREATGDRGRVNKLLSDAGLVVDDIKQRTEMKH